MQRILVTGGTGVLGSHLVSGMADRGMIPRVLSRKRAPARSGDVEWHRGDLLTGEGVPEALCDVDAVVHAARDAAGEADVEGVRLLSRLGPTAGVRYLLCPSIVGVSEIPLRYYRRKLAAEKMIEEGPLPWGILRTTQFHEFVDALLSAAARVPGLLPVPSGFRVQSVAAREVADRIVFAVQRRKEGMLPELAGPEVLGLEAMAHRWLESRRERRLVVPLPLPGRTARAFRQGRATAPEAEGGSMTWNAWLARERKTGRGDGT